MRALLVTASFAFFFACGGGTSPVVDGGSGGGATGGGSAMGGGSGGGSTGGSGGGSSAGGGTGGGSTTGGGGGTVDAGTVGPTGCVTDVTAGHHSFSCDSITYEVEIPSACTSGGCGVVFDVHGATMTAAAQDKSTGLRATAGALGYVVVQPTAPLVLSSYHSWTPATDDPKVWTFLQQTVTALLINPKKIHFTGFSQGGAMTYRMLCAHADVLASVAPVAAADGQTFGTVSPPFVLDCAFTGSALPSRQVPILQMHGTADALVPFSKATQQRDAAVSAWALGAPVTVTTNAKFVHTRYTSASGTVVEFLQHDYVAPTNLVYYLGGHCLPGGQDLPTSSIPSATMYFSCSEPTGFSWGQMVMQFFVAHPKP